MNDRSKIGVQTNKRTYKQTQGCRLSFSSTKHFWHSSKWSNCMCGVVSDIMQDYWHTTHGYYLVHAVSCLSLLYHFTGWEGDMIFLPDDPQKYNFFRGKYLGSLVSLDIFSILKRNIFIPVFICTKSQISRFYIAGDTQHKLQSNLRTQLNFSWLE